MTNTQVYMIVPMLLRIQIVGDITGVWLIKDSHYTDVSYPTLWNYLNTSIMLILIAICIC